MRILNRFKKVPATRIEETYSEKLRHEEDTLSRYEWGVDKVGDALLREAQELQGRIKKGDFKSPQELQKMVSRLLQIKKEAKKHEKEMKRKQESEK
jgi:hypothetical protein